MYYLKSIRPLNIFLIGFTQLLVYYIVIKPTLLAGNTTLALTDFLFGLLVADTLMIAAAGNVVNDIFDETSDQLNNKLKVGYEKPKAIIWFWILSINAVMTSVYVAWKIDALGLSIISIVALLLLVAYSAYFQKIALVGNFIVSLFISFVVGIVWFAERVAYQDLATKNETLFKYLTILVSSYMIFSFIANMYREIVKDIEDYPGDLKVGYQTIAVSWGVQRAKIIAIFYGGFLLILEIVWFIFNPILVPSVLNWIFFASIILPTCYVIYQTLQARSVLDFRKNSTTIKIIMGLGLFYLILINIY